MTKPSRRTFVGSWVLSLVPMVSPPAQVGADPYTGGDPGLMQAAGIVSYGPFEFGTDHTNRGVEGLLGDEPLHWVETAHFRIGAAVSELSTRRADRDWIRSVKAELVQLRGRLPKVPKNPRKLDPWLRAHLIAQRLERLYGQVLADLGVDESTFPTEPHDPAGPPGQYYGNGPYLGMAQKYSVLIVKRGASLARYTRAYGSGETTEPFRIYMPAYGGLAFVIAEESSEGKMANDQALHTQLVYNVVVNLVNGYRSYGHDIPPWLVFGLAHWHSRNVSPRFPAYERKSDGEDEDSPFWKWDERARGLMKFEAFEPLPELMARKTIGEFGMEQHIQCWYFVDYLMAAKKGPTMQLLHELKAPFHQQHKLPTHAELLARQEAAVRRAFGQNVVELEGAWREYARTARRKK